MKITVSYNVFYFQKDFLYFYNFFRNELYPFGVKVIVLEPGFFKTALAGPEENIVRLNKLWEKIPQKVKDDYGEEFFEKCKFTIVVMEWQEKY